VTFRDRWNQKTSKETAFRKLLPYRLMALPIFYDRKEERWQEKFVGYRRDDLERASAGGNRHNGSNNPGSRSVPHKAIFGPAAEAGK
jgi:hypothetical protein